MKFKVGDVAIVLDSNSSTRKKFELVKILETDHVGLLSMFGPLLVVPVHNATDKSCFEARHLLPAHPVTRMFYET